MCCLFLIALTFGNLILRASGWPQSNTPDGNTQHNFQPQRVRTQAPNPQGNPRHYPLRPRRQRHARASSRSGGVTPHHPNLNYLPPSEIHTPHVWWRRRLPLSALETTRRLSWPPSQLTDHSSSGLRVMVLVRLAGSRLMQGFTAGSIRIMSPETLPLAETDPFWRCHTAALSPFGVSRSGGPAHSNSNALSLSDPHNKTTAAKILLIRSSLSVGTWLRRVQHGWALGI